MTLLHNRFISSLWRNNLDFITWLIMHVDKIFNPEPRLYATFFIFNTLHLVFEISSEKKFKQQRFCLYQRIYDVSIISSSEISLQHSNLLGLLFKNSFEFLRISSPQRYRWISAIACSFKSCLTKKLIRFQCSMSLCSS